MSLRLLHDGFGSIRLDGRVIDMVGQVIVLIEKIYSAFFLGIYRSIVLGGLLHEASLSLAAFEDLVDQKLVNRMTYKLC